MAQQEISRRKILKTVLFSLAGSFVIDCNSTQKETNPPSDDKLLGVFSGAIKIDIVQPDGSRLDLYKKMDLASKNVFEIDGRRVLIPYESFYIGNPQIYEATDGQKWIKLQGFIKEGVLSYDTYIPYEKSEYLKIPRKSELLDLDPQNISFLEKDEKGYIDPARKGFYDARKYLDPKRIGEIWTLPGEQIHY